MFCVLKGWFLYFGYRRISSMVITMELTLITKEKLKRVAFFFLLVSVS